MSKNRCFCNEVEKREILFFNYIIYFDIYLNRNGNFSISAICFLNSSEEIAAENFASVLYPERRSPLYITSGFENVFILYSYCLIFFCCLYTVSFAV